jgi:hypothetical protein
MNNNEDNFIINKTYFFLGNLHIIENWKSFSSSETINPDSIFLGKFLGFQGFICNNDWLDRAKAIFEYGTISNNYFNKVKENMIST